MRRCVILSLLLSGCGLNNNYKTEKISNNCNIINRYIVLDKSEKIKCKSILQKDVTRVPPDISKWYFEIKDYDETKVMFNRGLKGEENNEYSDDYTDEKIYKKIGEPKMQEGFELGEGVKEKYMILNEKFDFKKKYNEIILLPKFKKFVVNVIYDKEKNVIYGNFGNGN